MLALRQADPQVEVREVGPQRLAHRPAVDAAEQLVGQHADGVGVIAAGGAGLPHRGLLAQDLQDGGPVEPERGIDGRGEAGQAGLMAHQLADRDVVLSGLSELRPVGRDGAVVVEQAALDAGRDQRRHHRLAGGEDRRERPPGEGRGPRHVGPARPQVDEHVAVAADAEAGGQFVQAFRGLGEVGGKGVLHGAETVGAGSVDLDHAAPLSRASQASTPSAATAPEAKQACSR